MHDDQAFATGDDAIVLVRVPTLPSAAATALLESMDPLPLLRQLVMDDPLVALAIEAASPSLSSALERWTKGHEDQAQRVALKSVAYVLRMATRATPFGLFANVGATTVGDSTTLTVGNRDAIRTRARPDMGWLLSRIRKAEQERAVRSSLILFKNDCVLERNQRLYITNSDVSISGLSEESVRLDYRPISIRKTNAVEIILEASRNGATLVQLRDAVAVSYSATDLEILKMIDQLWTAGLLISNIRPHPLGNPVLQTLKALDGIVSEAGAEIRSFALMLSDLDARPLSERSAEDYRGLTASDANGKLRPTYQLDATRQVNGTLGKDVIREARRLAEIFIRSNRTLGLEEYRRRFLEKYHDYNNWRPLLEVVDDDFGIGAPSLLVPKGPEHTAERSHALLALATGIYDTKSLEQSISESDLEVCLGPPHGPSDLPVSFDFGFQVAAKSIGHIRRGDFRVLPAPLACSNDAGKITGRFSDMLGAEVEQRTRSMHERHNYDGRIHAELVYVPGGDRAANVCLRPKIHPFELAFGIPKLSDSDPRISFDDLWICVEQERFRLWSRSRNREVVIHEGHMLHTISQAPSACRLLAMLDRDGKVFPDGFHWGVAKDLPMLPRLTVGKHLILSTARWHVPRSVFGKTLAEFESAVKEWRAKWNVPSIVLYSKGDNRLPINLGTSWGIELLYDQVRSAHAPVLMFEELFPDREELWVLDGNGAHYQAEFYASFFSVKRRPASAPNRSLPDIGVARDFGPGSMWTYVKLYCSNRQIDELLLRSIKRLVSALRNDSLIDNWFFIRYNDPLRHIRFRVKSVSLKVASQTRAVILDSCERLLSLGNIDRYALDTYTQELERYGGASAYEWIERLFAESSDMCIAQLDGIADDHDERVSRAILSFDDHIPRFVTEDIALACFSSEIGRPKRRLNSDEWRFIRELQKGLNMQRAERRTIGNSLSSILSLAETNALSQPLPVIIDILFHVHCNRMGLDSAEEQQMRELMWHLYYGRSRQEEMARQRVSVS